MKTNVGCIVTATVLVMFALSGAANPRQAQPVISWDSIADIDRYYVRIYQLSNQKEVFRSPRLNRTGYQVPGHVMAVGTSYVFRILAHDYDVCSQHASGFCVENRSSTWSRDFTPRAVK